MQSSPLFFDSKEGYDTDTAEPDDKPEEISVRGDGSADGFHSG